MFVDPTDAARMNQVLRHRLRNVAGGVKSAVSYLSHELQGRLTPEEEEYFPLILKECDGLSEMTSRMHLVFEEIPPGEKADVAEVVVRAVDTVLERFPDARVKGDEANLMGIQISSDQCLFMALQELLVNAIEAELPGCVTWDGAASPETLWFEIQGGAPSLTEEDLALMERPFYTTRTRHLGVGLPIAKRLIERMGGRIQTALLKGGGLSVRIEIPCAREDENPSATYGMPPGRPASYPS